MTPLEREIYELILRVGDLMAKDVPLKKAGVIPSLVRKGLVEVYKRPVSSMSKKTHKYIRVKAQEEKAEP